MIRQVICATIALCVTCSANASTVRFKQYVHPSDERYRTFYKFYLDGVMEGLETYNVSMMLRGDPPLYCLPPNLAMTEEQAEDIMNRKAKTFSNADADNLPISNLLLEGLKETFPCAGRIK